MPEINQGPDFLVVGAQRAGTTWLHRVLVQHQGLWLAPVKELHYFDRLDVDRTILDSKMPRRIASRPSLSLGPWLFNYWFRRRSDEWYASLFRQARSKGLIAGEITPAYATLSESGLEHIKRVNDEVKIIYVMRDPVDRVWSAIKKTTERKKFDTLTAQKALRRARNPRMAARSAYVDTITRLETVFSTRQIYYCFFDDLCDRPEVLLSEILSFLGVECDSLARLQIPQAINAAGSKAAPLEFSRGMAADYLPMVEKLCCRFEGPPRRWRARYEQLLSGA